MIPLHIMVFVGYAFAAGNLIAFWKTNRFVWLFFAVGQLFLANVLGYLLQASGQ